MIARLLVGVVTACTLTVTIPSSAHAETVATVTCGETITVDTRLRNDLVDCPGIGIVIGADDVRLDLNGHLVDGDGIRQEARTFQEAKDGEPSMGEGGARLVTDGLRDVAL